jgi:hypothetical protein
MMINRKLILPLGVMVISLFAVFGCGKRLPTDIDSDQGYPRTVMVEIFTSEFCPNCPKADAAAESLAMEMGDSLCLVEMHSPTFRTTGIETDSLGIVETDQLTTQYMIGMTGPTGLPLFACDGGDKRTGASTIDEAYQYYRQRVDIRKLQASPLKIALTAQSDQGKIVYSATITAGATLPSNSQLGLVLITVEDRVNAYGKVNRYVARNLKPGIEGELLTLKPSTNTTKTGEITKDAGWVPGRVSVIAYVRNTTTWEILQSAKARVIEATVPPVVPTLLFPADDSVGVSLSPTLVWNPANGAASYTLQYDNDSLFSGGISQSGLTATSFRIAGLANSTNHYWRVNASNNAGISAWSAVRSFTTTATALPAAPTQVTPYNGANGISRSPTLTWSAVPGAISYDVQVATDNSFAPQVMVAAPLGLTATSFAVTGLDSSATYHWRVRVTNAAGISAWSSPSWLFITTNGAPPAIPTLTSPANGELNAGTSPSLSWNSCPGATYYNLQVSTTLDFRYCIYENNSIAGTSQSITGLDSLSTYYWRVSASNSSGTSDWSDIWSFTDSRGYSFSRIIAPINGDSLAIPDTIIHYSLSSPPAEGYDIYIKNLSSGRLSITTQAPLSLNSDSLLFGGQICTESGCLNPGDPATASFNAGKTQHWTIHFLLSVPSWPVGLHYMTLKMWAADDPSHIMTRKLYLEVTP